MLAAGSLAFGHDLGGGLLGNLSLADFANSGHALPGLQSVGPSPIAVMTSPMMFAVITAAQIRGTTDRIKFFSFVLLIGVDCAAAVRLNLNLKLGSDDALDVLGVHGVDGLLGMLLLGLLATRSINLSGADGLLSGGGFHLLGVEALAAVVCASFAFAVSWLIAKLLDLTIGLRVSAEDEFTGLDLSQHAESAYAAGGMGRISS